MIYTNNINKFEKNLRKQLELTLNFSDLDYKITHSDRCIYITIYGTVLTSKDLQIIEALLTDSYILAANQVGVIQIWTTYEEEEKEGL